MSENDIRAFRIRVVKRLAAMVSSYLFGKDGPLHQVPTEDLKRSSAYYPQIGWDKLKEDPWWEDIPPIIHASGLKLGISIMDRQGKEITFYPEINFDMPNMVPLEAEIDYNKKYQLSKVKSNKKD